MPLQLTIRELEQLVEDRLPGKLAERFEILWDDIPIGIPGTEPDGSRPSDYIEDDGRQLRWFHFRDKETGEEYDFSYTWHADYNVDLTYGILGDMPDGIEIVEVSVLNPPAPPKPEPIKVKTPEELADELVWAPYRALEAAGEIRDWTKGLVPAKRVKELKEWLKAPGSFQTIYELRAKIIPVCVEFKVEHKSFWGHLQGWSKYK